MPVRVAGNTVLVLTILFIVFCVLPVVGCAVIGMLGSIGR
jgi:hypothetical protein